ncbi:MAG: hypothetical protein EXR62_10065 [Chloroflexi bacterium]|nr:hypothetical protein [Chloroflexota bacterium]
MVFLLAAFPVFAASQTNKNALEQLLKGDKIRGTTLVGTWNKRSYLSRHGLHICQAMARPANGGTFRPALSRFRVSAATQVGLSRLPSGRALTLLDSLAYPAWRGWSPSALFAISAIGPNYTTPDKGRQLPGFPLTGTGCPAGRSMSFI